MATYTLLKRERIVLVGETRVLAGTPLVLAT